MKKRLILSALILTVLGLQAQEVVKQTYRFDMPSINDKEGYSQIQFEGCCQSALAGQPSLPWQSVCLPMPEGMEAESIEVKLSDFITLDGHYQLFPYQPSRTYSDPERKIFYKDETLYASKSSYPEQNHGHLTTHFRRGAGYALSAFSPVQYNPSEGTVTYARSAEVTITTKPSEKAVRTFKGRTPSYDILVVTPSEWVASFDEYIDFYQQRGLRTRVEALEDIYSAMDGRDEQEKIRNFIIQEFENNGIQMVVLGGDTQFVPFRAFYCDVLSGGSHTTDNLPADLYYAALDGTWNDDNDNRWGEIGEDDLYPEVGIGRLCFNNEQQFNNIMHKTFTYQANPVLGEFRKVTIGGEHLSDSPWTNGSQYLELLIGDHDDNGYTTHGIPEDYDFTKLYYENGTWNGGALMRAINAGTQYVHHDGHANTNYVAGWYNESINDGNFSGANGIDHNYTFFHTSGCICGDFTSTCILELMTRISNFAVATFGNSRYGWFNEGQTEGPACHLHRETVDAYYHERIPQAGLALTEAKCQTAPWVNAPGQWEEGALRWNFYDLNLMGDPAVCPWHDEPFNPDVVYPVGILTGSDQMTVTVTHQGEALKNFRVGLFNEEICLGYAYTDDEGQALIQCDAPITEGSIRLIVTGCDAWPQTLHVDLIPNNTPYVYVNGWTLHDANNGIPEYGETIQMDLSLKNIGTANANNIDVDLNTDSQYITLSGTHLNVGSINAGDIHNIGQAFQFTLSDDVPDATTLPLIVRCSANGSESSTTIPLTVYAPNLTFSEVTFSDEQGNNNGIIEANEEIHLHITGKNNGHALAQASRLRATCDGAEIHFIQDSDEIGDVEYGETFEATIIFTSEENIVGGLIYEIDLQLITAGYTTHQPFIFSIGRFHEDFETGDFSNLDWDFAGDQPWTISEEQPHNGQYCAQSGLIDDDEISSLKITIDQATSGDLEFWYRTSTQEHFDFLIFYVDDKVIDYWGGENEWTKYTYTGLTEGTHTFEWRYDKSPHNEAGADKVWIDDILLPNAAIVTEVEESTVSHAIELMPNPTNGPFTLLLGDEDNTINIFNSLGQSILQIQAARGIQVLDLTGYSHGIYFVKVQNAVQTKTIKLIIN